MMQISVQQYGQEKVWERFENCIEKRYIFKVQVNKKDYTQELTTTKVFHEDEVKEYPNEVTQKIDVVDNNLANTKRAGVEIGEPSTPKKRQEKFKEKATTPIDILPQKSVTNMN